MHVSTIPGLEMSEQNKDMIKSAQGEHSEECMQNCQEERAIDAAAVATERSPYGVIYDIVNAFLGHATFSDSKVENS